MKNGFLVVVSADGGRKTVPVRERRLTFGRGYRNNLPLRCDIDAFTIAELQPGVLVLHFRDDMEIRISRGGRTFDLAELRTVLACAGSINLAEDTEVRVSASGAEFLFKAVRFEEEKARVIPDAFRLKLLSRENVSFSLLLAAVNGILFALLITASWRAALVPKPLPPSEKREEAPIEIAYRAEPSPKPGSGGPGGKTPPKRKESAPSRPAFFEGPVVKGTGILGVQEGAKNVIIAREKSLFSKLDETLAAVPVKGTGETSDRAIKVNELTEQAKKELQSAKADQIHSGPIKKEVKTELESAQRMKVVTKPPEVKIVTGRRPEGEILTVLGRYKKGFEFLFIDERKKDPALKGKVVVHFVIGGNGAVTQTEVLETDIANREFIGRIVGLIKSIKFPPSEHGDTGVRLPLVFFPS